jgi:hypothetical protein
VAVEVEQENEMEGEDEKKKEMKTKMKEEKEMKTKMKEEKETEKQMKEEKKMKMREDEETDRKCATMPKKMRRLVEISRQETNILFSFCIEGTDNNVAQQIRIQRQIVLHQSI